MTLKSVQEMSVCLLKLCDKPLLESYLLLNTELSVLTTQLEISQPLQCYDSADDEDVDPSIIIK